MIRNRIKFIILFLYCALLVGCDSIGTIPADKQNYIGTWYGQYMVLTITSDARVDYQYKKDSSSKSIDAPIKAFIGDDFKVGTLGIYTTFIVTKPPYYEDGVWKMVVDEQLVVRKEVKDNLSVL